MRRITSVFIVGTATIAMSALVGLFYLQPTVPRSAAIAVAVLSTLAVVAEILEYRLPRGARGSIAFVPYLSAVLIAPFWVTVVAILLVKGGAELIRRVEPLKVVFNVAQYVLAFSFAIMVYRLLHGPSLLLIAQMPLLRITALAGIPAVAATIACYVANGALVSTAISINSSTPIGVVWKEVKNPTATLDLLAGPLVFMFAWIYAAYGPLAAIAAWFPFLGYRHAHKNSLELEQTNAELLELMVKSLEARDPYTSGHSRRVQRYSAIIAQAMGLSKRDVDQISRAALLHDVGKIHEKYAPILSKADRLSPEEWVTMQQHPTDGANLVATMTKLRDVVPGIRHHHENWDGTGYPEGLAGELIPTASRIIRLADTIDAMTTERPYRSALTEAQVRSEVVRCRGTQFDPAIADKLLSSPLWLALFPAEKSARLVSSRRRFAIMATPAHTRDRVAAKSAKGA